MSNQETAIEVKNLSKDFILPHKDRKTLKSFFLNPFSKMTNEKQHALDSVSFEIKKGDFFGIVGRNGSGKSTLLKCIAGVYRPTKGHIKVNGSLVPFIELGVGFNPELTGRENVFLNGSLLGFSRQEMDDMYDEIVEFSELERFMDQKLKNYSSGMQVRLAFSIAIRAKGDILLLDEVLAVGDAAFQRKCNRFFEEVRGSGTTVVLVTHDMNAIQRFCNKAVLVEDGEIIKEGAPQEVADEYRDINMLSAKDGGSPKVNKRNETVSVDILKQTNDTVTFQMQHQEKNDEKYYFGFSIIKDGVGFAQLNNLGPEKPEIKNNKLVYELDVSRLTPGIYEIGATLFVSSNREPVAYTRRRPQFMIKGRPSSGILNLKDSWK